MQHAHPSFSSLIAVAIFVSGCASTPASNTVAATPVGPDCRQLEAAIANAEAEKRAAVKKEQDAWKAVVPIVVVARYVSGASGADSADKQLAKLEAEFAQHGCTRHGL